MDPGKNQETAVIDHQVEILFSLTICPADKLITRSHAPGRSRKPQKRYRFFCDANKKAHLSTAMAAEAKVMIAVDQFVPKRSTLALNRIEREPFDSEYIREESLNI